MKNFFVVLTGLVMVLMATQVNAISYSVTPSSVNLVMNPNTTANFTIKITNTENVTLQGVNLFTYGLPSDISVNFNPQHWDTITFEDLGKTSVGQVTTGVGIKPNTYIGIIIITVGSDNKTYSIPISVTVNEIKYWELLKYEQNVSVFTESMAFLNPITILNNGNVLLPILIIAPTDLIYIQDRVEIAPKSNVSLLLGYTLPRNSAYLPTTTDTTTYNKTFSVNVSLYSPTFTPTNQSYRITFVVSDTIPPEINSVDYQKTLTVDTPLLVKVNCTDNTDQISRVEIDFQDKSKFGVWDSSEKLYKTDFEPSGAVTPTLKVTCYDNYTNSISREFTDINVIPLQNVRIKNLINFGTKKFGKEISEPIITTNATLKGVKIEINGLDYDSAANITFSCMLIDTKSLRYPCNTTDIFLPEQVPGSIFLLLNSSGVTEFSGEFEVSLPNDQANPDPIITFDGAFRTYSTCFPQTLEIWGHVVTFEPIDTGIAEQSYCLVSARYPPDFGPEKYQIGVSAGEYQLQKSVWENQILGLQTDVNIERTAKLILLGIIVISVVSILIYSFVIKKGRWRFGFGF